MLEFLTIPTSPKHRDAANRVFFPAIVILAILYLYFVGPYGFVRGRGGHVFLFVTLFVMTIAPPVYVVILWSRRNDLIPLDRHMVYLPLLIWWAAFLGVQALTWSAFHGRPRFGPYGADKSMANALFESMAVLFLSGIYLLRFPLSRHASQAEVSTIASRLFWIVAAGAILVAAIVPPLPE